MSKEHTQVFIRKNFDGEVKVTLHETEVPTLEARMALSFMERWAMVAAESDGEDSAGRAKLRLMTADEITSHACNVAQKAVDQFRARGWVKNIPTAQECVDRLKGDGGKNEDKTQII